MSLPKITFVCETCGVTFESPRWANPRRFCSRPCYGMSRVTHGEYNSALFRAWRDAKQRCTNPRNKWYDRYGGRGITMCDEWLNDSAAFIAWMHGNLGARPDGHSLDRIDNDRGYEPGNLRWADAHTQSLNRERRGA